MLLAKRGSCIAATGILVMSLLACADRGEMYSADAAAGKTRVTATGCFQEMTGFDNFVLSNVGDAPGVDPAATRSYRIEQRGDFEQHVGKRVTITGWVDSPEAVGGVAAKKNEAGELDFHDVPELHVESVVQVSDNCGVSR